MKKLLLILTVWVSLFGTTFSQDSDDGPKNVVKINLFPIAIKNFSFQYERALSHKTSLCIGASYLLPIGLPEFMTSNDTSGTLKNLKVKGWSITPEFRWYPGTDKGAPRGFYLAPYILFAGWSLDIPIKYVEKNGTKHDYKIDGKYSSSLSAGLMIGAHWLISDRVSIDWWMLGGHFGFGEFKLIGTSPVFLTMSAQDIETAEKELYSDLSEIPGISNLLVDIEGDKVKVSSDLDYLGVRFGLTLGVAF